LGIPLLRRRYGVLRLALSASVSDSSNRQASGLLANQVYATAF
jgi:hypothetical protein